MTISNRSLSVKSSKTNDAPVSDKEFAKKSFELLKQVTLQSRIASTFPFHTSVIDGTPQVKLVALAQVINRYYPQGTRDIPLILTVWCDPEDVTFWQGMEFKEITPGNFMVERYPDGSPYKKTSKSGNGVGLSSVMTGKIRQKPKDGNQLNLCKWNWDIPAKVVEDPYATVFSNYKITMSPDVFPKRYHHQEVMLSNIHERNYINQVRETGALNGFRNVGIKRLENVVRTYRLYNDDTGDLICTLTRIN
jgi:hypothetical protein